MSFYILKKTNEMQVAGFIVKIMHSVCYMYGVRKKDK